MSYFFLKQGVKTTPKWIIIVMRVLAEVLCGVIMLLIVRISIKKRPCKPYQLLLPVEELNVDNFHTGDILISFGDYLDDIHPGHISLVWESHRYCQKYIWDLDSNQELHLLKPILPYIEQALKDNGKIFVRHSVGSVYDPVTLMRLMRKYADSKYDFQSVLDHGNFIFHQYFGFPGIPVFPETYHYFYCSEIIFTLLIEYGSLDKKFLQLIPDSINNLPDGNIRILYPNLLLDDIERINDYARSGFHYAPAKKIIYSGV